MTMDKISCPNCGHRFDMEGAVANELKVEFEQKLNKEKHEIEKRYKQKALELAARERELEEKKKKENTLFKERLELAKKSQEKELKEKIKDDFNMMIQSQQKELTEQTEKIKSLQEKEIKLMQAQRKLEEAKQSMAIEMEKKLSNERKVLEENIHRRLKESVELKLKEKDKQLEDQRKLIEEMRRKSEQGSMQMQGEVQELAIEEILKSEFPYDQVEEVPKGIRGADTIHTVINQHFQVCGKIIYESKRTKNFANDWIDKLKMDQRAVQAQIAVLVTETLPKNLEQFGQVNGVWVCTFQEFKSLIFVLREILLKTAEVASAQENKGDKMEMLYQFLTSEEFKLQITGIVDAFSNLKDELDREKRAMQTIWKKREKQLDLVMTNTIEMYGSIKGIAGKAIPTVHQLELPEGDEASV